MSTLYKATTAIIIISIFTVAGIIGFYSSLLFSQVSNYSNSYKNAITFLTIKNTLDEGDIVGASKLANEAISDNVVLLKFIASDKSLSSEPAIQELERLSNKYNL